MKKLHENTKERFAKQNELSQKKEVFKKEKAQFEEDIFKVINAYVNEGLSKSDLVHKMKWITSMLIIHMDN